MKRFKKLALVLVAALIISMTAPSVVPNMGATVSAASKKVKLNKSKIALTKGNKYTLKLKNAKASKVKWSSKNKKVATVSKKGVVAAKNAGTTKVTAKYGKKTYTCTVKVVNPVAPAPAPVAPVAPAPVAPSVAPAPVVTNPTEPIAIQNPSPVFNGASLTGMTATRSTTYRYEYNIYGTVCNTSPYQLSYLAVNVTGYAANGVAVCTGKSISLSGPINSNSPCAINGTVYCDYDIAYFTIDSVRPSFSDSNEAVNVSNVSLPSTYTGTAQGFTLSNASLTAKHGYDTSFDGTFDSYRATLKFSLGYTIPEDESRSIKITINCLDASGAVINTVSDTDKLYDWNYRTDYEFTLNYMPYNTASIAIVIDNQ